MSNEPDDYRWVAASADDAATALGLMREFYAEEGLVFDPHFASATVGELLARPELGRLFLLKNGQDVPAVSALGHLVLTWGFSLEFRGRYVLLDELYLVPRLRGKRLGTVAIEFAARWAEENGATSLRLEVNHANTHAKQVYSRSGFGDDRRDLMTRWL